MVQHWMRKPKALVLTPLLLALALALACGGAAKPTPLPPTAATTPPATGPARATATPVPGATPARTPAPTLTRLEKSLHLTVTPLPQETFIPWLRTISGSLPYQPITEHLATIDPQTGVSVVLPQLATEWDMGPGAKTWTFKLRKGVPFHFNWGEFTVRDFINSLDYAVSDESLTGCTGPLRAAMGAKSATEMLQKGNLKVIDDYTLTMNLASPQVDLISWWFNILQYSCAPIWSSAQFKEQGEAMFEKGPAYTGPYQFVRRALREFTELERVPYNHWRVNPEFKTLRISTAPEEATRLAMLLTREADMVDIAKVLHDQATAAGMVILESDLPANGLAINLYGQYYLSQVNWKPDEDAWAAPGEKGRLVREALNRAVNRKQLINVLFKGRGEPMYNTIFHQSLEGWNPEWETKFEEKYGYDPEKAKKLLDQAGYPGIGGKNRFKMEVGVSSLPGLPETIEAAQAIGQAFENIGIDVKFTEADFSHFIDLFRDRHDAHFILPVRATIRPITQNMRIFYYTGLTDPAKGIPTRGVSYFEDPLYDQVYERLLVETDPKELDRLAREAGNHIYDNYRSIPVVWTNPTLVVNPAVVAEYHFGPVTGVFTHLEYISAAR